MEPTSFKPKTDLNHMKLLNTPEQIKALAESLKPLYVKLFACESCDPKRNAQRNLSGRTHYVDDDTLRWHKARINGASDVQGSHGLLFRITESCALDMHNRSRGNRCVVFDVFGTVVYHPDLENTFSTSAKAQTACNETPFDLVAHYRKAIEAKLAHTEREAATLLSIVQNMEAASVVNAVLAERS